MNYSSSNYSNTGSIQTKNMDELIDCIKNNHKVFFSKNRITDNTNGELCYTYLIRDQYKPDIYMSSNIFSDMLSGVSGNNILKYDALVGGIERLNNEYSKQMARHSDIFKMRINEQEETIRSLKNEISELKEVINNLKSYPVVDKNYIKTFKDYNSQIGKFLDIIDTPTLDGDDINVFPHTPLGSNPQMRKGGIPYQGSNDTHLNVFPQFGNPILGSNPQIPSPFAIPTPSHFGPSSFCNQTFGNTPMEMNNEPSEYSPFENNRGPHKINILHKNI